jgi:serine/threonine-protein kinase
MLEPPPRLSERRSDLPPALDDVIAKGMAKDPDDRPASATELMQDAARASPEAAAPVVPPPAPAKEGGQRGVGEATRARPTSTVEPPPTPAAPSRRWSSVIEAVRQLGRRGRS